MQDAKCFCPEELGGAGYFKNLTEYSDWNPTHEHFPISKEDGGHRKVDNAILAHRLCNRIDYAGRMGNAWATRHPETAGDEEPTAVAEMLA
jgi:hypothetical protein